MDIAKLVLERYDPLNKFYMEGFWKTIPTDLMRIRPHPNVNSIAWNLWHLTRAEDAGLNRFVVDRPQVLDEGGWMDAMNLPWRHHGSEMSFDEVEELSQRIDLQALYAYSQAVQARTREILQNIHQVDLDVPIGIELTRQVCRDEGLAHSDAEGFAQNYASWTRGKALLSFAVTHPFQHVGEIEVLATLQGVVFG
jgi:uncharacterized damage-inducible protein DinB